MEGTAIQKNIEISVKDDSLNNALSQKGRVIESHLGKEVR